MSLDKSIEILGDPRKLLEYSEREFLERLASRIEDLKSDGYKVINDIFERKDRELRRRVEDAVRDSRLAIESFRSKIEVEVKNTRNRIKEGWINKALDEVRKMVIEKLKSDEDLYRSYLKSSLEKVLSGSSGKLFIEGDSRTIRIISGLIERDFKDHKGDVELKDAGEKIGRAHV